MGSLCIFASSIGGLFPSFGLKPVLEYSDVDNLAAPGPWVNMFGILLEDFENKFMKLLRSFKEVIS